MKCPRTIMREPDTTQKTETDFSEYMWMAEEGVENFDRQVENELWEEMFIEACFEEMLAEEEQWFYPPQDCQLSERLNGIHLSAALTEEQVANSQLNPNAPEFVPKNLQSHSTGN